MAIFKRGRIYWYHFIFNGKHVQNSTKQGNPRVARQMEAAHRTALAKGEVGFREQKLTSLRDFLKQDFLPFVETQFKEAKPNTLRYYQYGVQTLRDSALAGLNLSELNSTRTHMMVFGVASYSPEE